MNIYDNVLHPVDFKNFRNEILSPNFSWHHTPTASMHDSHYSWAHVAYLSGGKRSSIADEAESIVYRLLKRANEPISKLLRIRFGLHTVTERNVIDDPHVDDEREHKVGLLYLTETDGQTRLYNETYDYDSDLNSYNYYKTVLKETVTLKDECMPKENRLLLFDGKYYHASTSPTFGLRRVTLNFNYLP